MLEEMQQIAFQIIATTGEARSNFIEAIQQAREGDQETSLKLMKEGEALFTEVHHLHHGLIQREAEGQELPFSLILMHAEDLLISTETLKVLAKEMIAMKNQLVNTNVN